MKRTKSEVSKSYSLFSGSDALQCRPLFHIFSHSRRVRSLETDLQYEERVTAEIENFLREQLVRNPLFLLKLTFEINEV